MLELYLSRKMAWESRDGTGVQGVQMYTDRHAYVLAGFPEISSVCATELTSSETTITIIMVSGLLSNAILMSNNPRAVESPSPSLRIFF